MTAPLVLSSGLEEIDRLTRSALSDRSDRLITTHFWIRNPLTGDMDRVEATRRLSPEPWREAQGLIITGRR